MVRVDLELSSLNSQQKLMLETVYPHIKNFYNLDNLAVALLDHGWRKGEYIVDRIKLEAENSYPDSEEANFLGSVIVANLDWLTRRYNKIKATQDNEPLPKVKYTEFDSPDGIFTLDNHAVAQDHLTQLRDSRTEKGAFNEHAYELTRLLLAEATRDLPMTTTVTTTPMTEKTGTGGVSSLRLKREAAASVSILRAGNLMLRATEAVLPNAPVGTLGMQRVHDDPESKPEHYYEKLVGVNTKQVALLLDPMLATGGSMSKAISALKEESDKKGIKQRIRVVSLIAAPEGIRRVQADHPDVEIYVAAIDSHLTEDNYIAGEGLGDAGDRGHGTIED